MGGPALNLRGCFNGYLIECDGQPIAFAKTFFAASALYREFRAVRAFAAETLHHTLARKDA